MSRKLRGGTGIVEDVPPMCSRDTLGGASVYAVWGHLAKLSEGGRCVEHTAMEEKTRLRGALSARRAGQDRALAQRALLAQPLWREARQVAAYVALPDEMDTALLLEDVWGSGRELLLPRCRKDQPGYMDFVPCAGSRELVPGTFRVPEPLPEIPALSWGGGRLAPDIIVVPGVGFDRRGRRLGYGGGYYDRALAHPALARTVVVGLAFALQLVEAVPAEAWDRPVHALCTEEGFTWL